MKQPVFLRIYLNGQLQQTSQHTDDQIVIGSSEEVQLRLSENGVSPVHAVIEQRDAGYYVSDLGSQQGTFKGNQKVSDEKLHSGDELQIGPYRIEFFIGVPKPTQPPKSVPTDSAPAATPVEAPPDLSVRKKKSEPSFNEVKPVTPAVRASDGPLKSPATRAAANEAKPSRVLPAQVRTFAPSSSQDYSRNMKKSRGTSVEVVVAWRDRVVGTYLFHEKGDVTIGSAPSNSIVIPLLGSARPTFTLLKIAAAVRIQMTPDMAGDYYKDDEKLPLTELKRKNRMVQSETGFAFDLAQGEAVRLSLHGDLVSVYVRYVPEPANPLVAPLLDFTASESTAILMAFVIAAIFGLYMLIYSPKPPEDELMAEQPIRKATVTFNVPKKPTVVVEASETKPQEKKIVKVDMKQERTTTKPDPGKAAEVRPNPSNVKKPSVLTSSVDKGASVNTGKSAASAQSEKRDVSKLGMLGAFGGKGTQKEINKTFSGAGELVGDAEKATGFSGANDSRAGENLGARLKNVGQGGKGTATYGVADVGTQGKGTGTFGAGGGGLGKRGRVDLNVGESDAEFTGSIDREAIRRVIRENLKLFENCYNQALRRSSDAYGKIEITWNIEERGRATKAFVKSNSVGDKPMGECIARVIKSLTFPEPPPDQVAQVTYPFVFAAQ